MENFEKAIDIEFEFIRYIRQFNEIKIQLFNIETLNDESEIDNKDALKIFTTIKSLNGDERTIIYKNNIYFEKEDLKLFCKKRFESELKIRGESLTFDNFVKYELINLSKFNEKLFNEYGGLIDALINCFKGVYNSH